MQYRKEHSLLSKAPHVIAAGKHCWGFSHPAYWIVTAAWQWPSLRYLSDQGYSKSLALAECYSYIIIVSSLELFQSEGQCKMRTVRVAGEESKGKSQNMFSPKMTWAKLNTSFTYKEIPSVLWDLSMALKLFKRSWCKSALTAEV